MEIVLIAAGILLALFLLIWFGLTIQPTAFPPFAQQSGMLHTYPLPEGLPAPVERFYKVRYGENETQLPVIHTAVLSGRGNMAPFGFKIPMRFRFLYEVGKNYRARIEMTFYGRPFMMADETYIDGHALGNMPSGVDEGPWFDDAMNVRIWCEALNWFPSVLLTDPRVCWLPFDEETAILVVPFGQKQQRVLVRFDPETGDAAYIEAMKYRTAKERILWINAVWFDQGKRWLFMDIEEKCFNIDVQEAIRGKA